MYWFWKPLSRKKSDSALQQVLGAEAEILAGVARIANRFHGATLVELPPRRPAASALLGRRLALAFAGRETRPLRCG